MKNTLWDAREWEIYREKLSDLSVEQLRAIANRVGVNFTQGNETISEKEDFLNVLDESVPDELKKAYEEMKNG